MPSSSWRLGFSSRAAISSNLYASVIAARSITVSLRGKRLGRSAAMPYTVPDLPYDFAALEPHVDEATMRVHHDKHHAAYVTNLNAAIEGTQFDGRPIEQVLAELDLLPEDKQTAVRNNGGGHANHTPFREIR